AHHHQQKAVVVIQDIDQGEDEQGAPRRGRDVSIRHQPVPCPERRRFVATAPLFPLKTFINESRPAFNLRSPCYEAIGNRERSARKTGPAARARPVRQGEASRMYKRILMAADGSREGMVALREGALIAQVYKAKVFLLGVVRDTTTTLIAD